MKARVMVAALATAGLLALTGCGSNPQVAAYVGGPGSAVNMTVTQSEVDTIANEIAATTSDAYDTGASFAANVMQIMVQSEIAAKVAKDKAITVTDAQRDAFYATVDLYPALAKNPVTSGFMVRFADASTVLKRPGCGNGVQRPAREDPGAGEPALRRVGRHQARPGRRQLRLAVRGGPHQGVNTQPELSRLVAVMHRLRTGCPWDAEQTHASLVRYLVEETLEVVEAIEAGDDTELTEELGDLLLQVVFHAEIAAESGRFDIEDVARRISDKLIARHPYVFTDAEVPTDLVGSWERAKAVEKSRDSALDGIPERLSALTRAHKVLVRARSHGLDPGVLDVTGTDVACRRRGCGVPAPGRPGGGARARSGAGGPLGPAGAGGARAGGREPTLIRP